jgi:hypothetical protein
MILTIANPEGSMRPYRSLMLLLALLPACAGGASPQQPPSPAITETPATPSEARAPASTSALAAAAATITADDVHRHIAFLASDELRGRDTPSPGLDRAAEYVADRFRSFGLEPGAPDGSYIQHWPFGASGLDADALALRIRAGDETSNAEYGTDYFLLPSPADSVTGDLFFAGTASQTVSLSADAAGAIVVFYAPGATVDQAWGQAVSGSLSAAVAARAAGVLLVVDPEFDPAVFGGVTQQVAGQLAPLPLVGMNYAPAKAVLGRAGHDLDTLRASAAGLAPLDATLTVRAARTSSEASVPNVIAVWPGSDPALRDTYVVFSAHIDHVGVGAPDASGDSIYNGADDDASGTSTLLEVAEAFAALEPRPARSIAFIGVSGEEKGLLGSAHYMENPTIAAEQMVANINIDMVGRNAPDTVVAIGQEYTTLGEAVQRVARAQPDLGLVIAPDLWPEERLYFRSDHFSFANKGVPAIFFTSGLHDDYHRPSDEVDTIDTDKVARIARLVFHLAHDIATNVEPPAWTEKGRAEVGGTTRD